MSGGDLVRSHNAYHTKNGAALGGVRHRWRLLGNPEGKVCDRNEGRRIQHQTMARVCKHSIEKQFGRSLECSNAKKI